MQDSEQLLRYLKKGVDELLEQGSFDGAQEFRRTQEQALQAYKKYLNKRSLTTEQKLKGFFEIATGIGKTGIFVGIIGAAIKAAEADGEELKAAIVVPTNQLLNDTPADIAKFAPHLADKVGLYGDGHKNLKKQVTVITYDSWYDLSASGKIGSHNIDILISDEAHRGTSERRIEGIKDAFNAQTVQLAFTATAHFDEEKSVESSHECEIFYKGLREGVKEGELASYISSQPKVVRVEPTELMFSDEFESATKEDKAAYKKRLRQKAWNLYVTKLYKSGRDEYTGDLLTDNQAGFFVEGIWQANNLEKTLNADEELSRRAKARGCKGVAVAIHSRLSSGEIKKRFEDYKAGRYLAAVGDEKFKEGFDHPPMKTIFDTMHSSIVDKAQIIGRGARKWWNDLKKRFEGLTVIDTIIYIGDEDNDLDNKLRKRAERNAVSVEKVIKGKTLDGPGLTQKTKKIADRKVGERPDYHIENVNYDVESKEVFTLREQVEQFEKDKLRPITESMLSDLEEQISRTGLEPTALLNAARIEVPDDIDIKLISAWRKRDIQNVKGSVWDWVLEEYQTHDSTSKRLRYTQQMQKTFNDEVWRTGYGTKKIARLDGAPSGLSADIMNKWKNGRAATVLANHWSWALGKLSALPSKDKQSKIDITDEMRQTLNDHMDRTGVKYITICNDEGKPAGLKPNEIRGWISSTKQAVKLHWDWVIEKYTSLPDARPRIEITDEMCKNLNAQIERTGHGPQRICALASVSEEINHRWVDDWKTGYAKTADKKYWYNVMEALEELPDEANRARIPLTKEMRKELDDQIERTGVKAEKFASKHILPDGMNKNTIRGWQKETTTEVDQEYWGFAINKYAELPTILGGEKIAITDAMRAQLQQEMQRTGYQAAKFYNGLNNPPANLNKKIIQNWSDGATKSVYKKLWDWVVEKYSHLPDADLSAQPVP